MRDKKTWILIAIILPIILSMMLNLTIPGTGNDNLRSLLGEGLGRGIPLMIINLIFCAIFVGSAIKKENYRYASWISLCVTIIIFIRMYWRLLSGLLG